MKKRDLKPENFLSAGFTVIELVVTTALISIVLASVLNISHSVFQQNKQAKATGDLNTIILDVRALVKSPDQCSSSIKGLNLKTSSSHSLAAISYIDSTGKKTPRYEVSKIYDSWKLDSIDLVSETEIRSGLYFGRINMNFSSTATKGGQSVSRRAIPVHIETDSSGKITSCLSLNSVKPSVNLVDLYEICNVVSEGTDGFDEVTNTCQSLYDFQVFTGDDKTASCPAGWTISSCTYSYSSDTAPATTSAKFPSGTVSSGPPPVYSTSNGKNGCDCVAAIGVTGPVCKVKCKQPI